MCVSLPEFLDTHRPPAQPRLLGGEADEMAVDGRVEADLRRGVGGLGHFLVERGDQPRVAPSVHFISAVFGPDGVAGRRSFVRKEDQVSPKCW